MTRSGHNPSTTTAHVFEIVWNTLVGVLGTVATATLLRRAVRDAVARRPELAGLREFNVTREGLEYRYVLPLSWRQADPAALDSLRYLIRETLCPLLQELTGTVVTSLLERQPELQQQGILAGEERTS